MLGSLQMLLCGATFHIPEHVADCMYVTTPPLWLIRETAEPQVTKLCKESTLDSPELNFCSFCFILVQIPINIYIHANFSLFLGLLNYNYTTFNLELF